MAVWIVPEAGGFHKLVDAAKAERISSRCPAGSMPLGGRGVGETCYIEAIFSGADPYGSNVVMLYAGSYDEAQTYLADLRARLLADAGQD